jgi:hypothetical protein
MKWRNKGVKQMKKKILTIGLAVVILTLTACNDGDSGDRGNDRGGGNNNASAGTGGNPPPVNNPPFGMEVTPVEDFEYGFNAAIGGVEIVKYNGTSMRVRIPDTIEGVAVTGISWGAFADSRIMEVHIPNTVTVIGTLSNLPPGEAGAWAYAQTGAFSGTQLTSVTIPDSVTEIGANAFRNTPLTSVVLPDSVTKIGMAAFENTQITSLNLPDSLEYISPQGGFHEGFTATFRGVTYETVMNNIGLWLLPNELYRAVNDSGGE